MLKGLNSFRGNRSSPTQRPSSARKELLTWARARDFRDRATEYLNVAPVASDSNAQRRLTDIAQHYRLLAAAEARDAGRLGDERRKQSKTSENGSFDGRAEIQTLRLKLRLFANQQTGQTMRAQCFAVDKTLAEISEGNALALRQVLASHVQCLERALRRSTEKGAVSSISQSNETPVSPGTRGTNSGSETL